MTTRPSFDELAGLVLRPQGLHERIADAMDDPGRVWCCTCGQSQRVDAAACLREGWPSCCGQTMTLDPPETWT
jgi:hypothetical protein